MESIEMSPPNKNTKNRLVFKELKLNKVNSPQKSSNLRLSSNSESKILDFSNQHQESIKHNDSLVIDFKY